MCNCLESMFMHQSGGLRLGVISSLMCLTVGRSINCNSVLIDDIGLSIALCYFVKLNAMCQLQSEDLRLGHMELLDK